MQGPERLTEKEKSSAIARPFDAIDCRIAEASDIIIVTVYRASGGKHHAVSRETRDLQDHHIFSQTTVHLATDRN